MSDFDPDVFGAAPASGGGGAAPAAAFDSEIFSTPAADNIPRVEVRGTADSKPLKMGTNSQILDAANATATGYNRGLLRLAGLPVDTAANVIDLGKAALGSAYTAITDKAPPTLLELRNRADVFGSGDYLIDRAARSKVGDLALNPANSKFEGGYLQNAGSALAGGIAMPGTKAQLLNQAILAVSGATAGKFVGDTTGNTALAIAAGMAPTAIQNAATSGVQRLVRGGEDGRRNMEQRIQDLQNAGVENPTVGLASGSPLIGGVENMLSSTPGAVGVMRNARTAAVDGLQARTQQAADLASNNRGTLEAGTAIQRGLNTDFRDRTRADNTRLYNRLDATIPPDTPTNVARSRQAIIDVNPEIPGAPALTPMFQNGRMMGIGRAMDADTAGTPGQPAVPPVMSQVLGPNGQPIQVTPGRPAVPAGPPTDQLPFTAVRQLRTNVGREISDNTLMSDVPRSRWNPLYGALSEDIRGVAAQTGPAAESAFNRANDHNRAMIGRMERVAPFADAATPETALRMYQRAGEDNLSTLQAVKKSLPADARGSAAGTIIERLGKARAGSQDETGTVWSPETFLTNYNKMTPATRAEMFSGFRNSPEVKSAVDQVARATAMMRDSSKLWANPSGTGANLASRGTLGAIGLGGAGALIGMVNPLVPLGAGAAVGGANLLARGLTSPSVVRGMASQNYLSPGLQLGTGGQLLTSDYLKEYR